MHEGGSSDDLSNSPNEIIKSNARKQIDEIRKINENLQKIMETDTEKNYEKSLDSFKSPRESMELPDIKEHPEFKSLEKLFSNLKTRI